MTVEPDLDELPAATGDDIRFERLPDWQSAASVLPIYPLCRSLFSQSPANTGRPSLQQEIPLLSEKIRRGARQVWGTKMKEQLARPKLCSPTLG